MARADALLVATPEYNHGVPGVLKNAIDWASRPRATSPLRDKPIAVLGASPGRGETARAQAQLRDSFVFTGACVMPLPELLVGGSAAHFDVDGNVTGRTITLTVRDHGSWRQQRRRENGGYGFPLMRQLMGRVEVHAQPHETRITMRKLLARTPCREPSRGAA